MATRDLNRFERTSLLLALVCLGFSAVAMLHYWSGGRTWATPVHEQVIRVTGVQVPSEEANEFLVYAGSIVYRVSDSLRTNTAFDDPVFLFTPGKEYRVKTRGDVQTTLLGPRYPEIIQVSPGARPPRLTFSN